jgi:LmbE family N-acetylglucosaminyl deacetylase
MLQTMNLHSGTVILKTDKTKSVCLIVAHPDDETLWAGGTILTHPAWKCIVVCLCRRSDFERATKFHQALKFLHADGIMGDLDDGPHQKPLEDSEVESVIMELLPRRHYNLIITHGLSGEYTRHLRHEEVSKAVIRLWQRGEIDATELWTFAYEDGNRKYYPIAIEKATAFRQLTQNIWLKKQKIITQIYGFGKNSWEAKTTPHSEAFWQFSDHSRAQNWIERFGSQEKKILNINTNNLLP